MISLAGVQVISGFRFGFGQPCVIFKTDTPKEFRPDARLEQSFLEILTDILPARDEIKPDPEGADPIVRLLALSARFCGAMQDSVGVPVVDPARIIPLTGAAADTRNKTWLVAQPTHDPYCARLAFDETMRILNGLIDAPAKRELTGDEQRRFNKTLDKIAQFSPPGSNSPGFVRQALRSGIPMISLPGSAWQFGWGRLSRVFQSSLSDATSAIGVGWAREKAQTNQLLSLAGLPVAEQVPVADLDEALQAAVRFGYPVVLKAANLDKGKGVEAGLQNETELRAAFTRVASHERQVLLERHIDGVDVRVNVLCGQYLTAVIRHPAAVVGDGVQSIAELIAETNRDPRRSKHRFSQMRPLTLNEEAHELMASQGVTRASIPEAGQEIRLRRTANVSSGGYSVDTTQELHPDNVDLSVRVTKLLRLDIAGIDLLLPDPTKSWKDTGGAVCEVNAQPQIGATFPTVFRDVFDQFIADQGRIPTVFLLTDDSNTTAWVQRAVSATQGIKGLRIIDDVHSGSSAPNVSLQDRLRMALVDPETSACIVVSDARDVLKDGVPIDRFDALWVGKWQGDANLLTRRIGMTFQHITHRVIALDGHHPDNAALREVAKSKPVTQQSFAEAFDGFRQDVSATANLQPSQP